MILASQGVDNWDTLPLDDPMDDPHAQRALSDDHAEGSEVAVMTKSLETMSLRGDQETSYQGTTQVEPPPKIQEFHQAEMMGVTESEVSNKGVISQGTASGMEHEQATAPMLFETAVHEEIKDPVETPEEQATVEGTPKKENDLMSTLAFANGKTLEAVKADTWISQAESKAVLRKVKSNKRMAPEESDSSSLPKPESWGQVPHLSPDEQCPPKKRGRKPKADTDSAPAKTSETTKSKTKATKGPKTKTAKSTKKDSNQGDADNTRGSPSQRLKKYLEEQKKKRKAAEEEAEAPSKKKRSQKTTKVETPEESAAGEARPKKRQYKRKAKQTSAETDAQEGDMHVTEVHVTEVTGPEVEAGHAEDPALARKKKQSRKSSAYHVAYRATQGSEEEKRAAAKKVSKAIDEFL